MFIFYYIKNKGIRIMRTYSLIIAMFIAILSLNLTGCASVPPTVIYKTTVIAPDDNLLTNCPVQEPPNKEDYIAATMKDREKMLVDFSSTLMKNSFICNKKFEVLREWKKDSTQALEKSSD